MARELSETVLPPRTEASQTQYDSRTVAMLCASSPDFLFLWLGLTRLGFSSLHVAYAPYACEFHKLNRLSLV